MVVPPQGGTRASARDLNIGRGALPGPTSGPDSLCDLSKWFSISGSVSSSYNLCKPHCDRALFKCQLWVSLTPRLQQPSGVGGWFSPGKDGPLSS